jgi:phage shock protein A
MALVTRLTRLFQADFHAVLDRIEEPDLQLRQAVREMQLALDQDRQGQRLLQHQAAQLAKTLTSLEANMAALDEELDICLANNKDDLARDLVRRKLGAEKQLRAAGEQNARVELQQQTLERQIDEQNQQLDSMKQKLELLVSGDEDPFGAAPGQGDAIRSEEVEIALLREKERRAKS